MSTTLAYQSTEPNELVTDLQRREQDAMCVNESKLSHPRWYLLKYLVFGMVFGIILVKSEVVAWYRIQEMFRLQSFHMYGVIGTAIAVGMLSLQLIKRRKAKTLYGEPIVVKDKKFNKGNVIGGLTFGVGWALTGACPGPLYAHVGTGALIMLVPLFFALVGTWTYSRLRNKLPH